MQDKVGRTIWLQLELRVQPEKQLLGQSVLSEASYDELRSGAGGGRGEAGLHENKPHLSSSTNQISSEAHLIGYTFCAFSNG